MNLKDDDWNRIKRAGSLPDECRALLIQKMEEYHYSLSRTTAPRSTGRLMKQAKNAASKLHKQLEAISKNAVFQRNGLAELSPSRLKFLCRVKDDMGRLDRELTSALLRLKKVPHRMSEEQSALGNYIWHVLMIRSESLRKPMPTSISETAMTGKYRSYVELCVNAVDQKLTLKRIEASLKAAIDLYQRVRSDDDAFTTEFR